MNCYTHKVVEPDESYYTSKLWCLRWPFSARGCTLFSRSTEPPFGHRIQHRYLLPNVHELCTEPTAVNKLNIGIACKF